MPRKHLQFIGGNRVDSYRISPRQQNDDPEVQNTSEVPDYSHQKSIYRDNLETLNATIVHNSNRKRQLVDDNIFPKDLVDSLQEHYLKIKTYGRIPMFFLKDLKKLYKSIEFKCYTNYNRQVILNISGEDLALFIDDLTKISFYNINGPDFITEHKFSSFKLIESFSYYAMENRLQVSNYSTNSFLLQFFNLIPTKIDQIIELLKPNGIVKQITPSIYEWTLNGDIPESQHNTILTEYISLCDDIQSVQQSFVDIIVSPNTGDIERSSLLLADYEEDSLPIVGIIDSGVAGHRSILAPFLKREISKSYIDTTPFVDSQNHGTGVASLVVFGEQINDNIQEIVPYAKIVSLKIFGSTAYMFGGDILKTIIQESFLKGIRIFNMSINLTDNKKDNENHDLITYILDYILANPEYRNVLFFVSAGNLCFDDQTRLRTKYSNSLNFRFDEETNICTPADSTNAISVGSMNSANHISDFSRKNCIDYGTILTKKRSGSDWKITTDIGWRTPYGNKPDFVFLGEDVKMLSNAFSDEITCNSGTSFSAPLTCNIACRLVGLYPSLSANAIKALMLNSSSGIKGLDLDIDPNDGINLWTPTKIRNSYIRGEISKGSNSKIQDREIKLLQKRYIGFGKPNIEKIQYSEPNKVSIIIDDMIQLNSENIYEINIPDAQTLLGGTGKFQLTGSLSYNHIPILSDHVNYNPIHIGYRLLACSEIELKTITNQIKASEAILSQLTEDTPEYEAEFLNKKGYEAIKNTYVIDIGGKGWSHDNYYWIQYTNNQSTGNTQNIEKQTLKKKLNDKLFIEIRCNIKTTDTTTNIFSEIQSFIWDTLQKRVSNVDQINRYMNQYFGFCLTIEDKSGSGIDIYQRLLDANISNLVEIQDIQTETELENILEQSNEVETLEF